MENQNILSKIQSLKNKQVTKATMFATAIFLTTWLITNLWTGGKTMTQEQAASLWQTASYDFCMSQKNICTEKLKNTETFSEEELLGCVSKAKAECSFQ